MNCTGNTMGGDCERCVDGYDRTQPLTILPCDRCAEGYWDSGGGVCTREWVTNEYIVMVVETPTGKHFRLIQKYQISIP